MKEREVGIIPGMGLEISNPPRKIKERNDRQGTSAFRYDKLPRKREPSIISCSIPGGTGSPRFLFWGESCSAARHPREPWEIPCLRSFPSSREDCLPLPACCVSLLEVSEGGRHS